MFGIAHWQKRTRAEWKFPMLIAILVFAFKIDKKRRRCSCASSAVKASNKVRGYVVFIKWLNWSLSDFFQNVLRAGISSLATTNLTPMVTLTTTATLTQQKSCVANAESFNPVDSWQLRQELLTEWLASIKAVLLTSDVMRVGCSLQSYLLRTCLNVTLWFRSWV